MVAIVNLQDILHLINSWGNYNVSNAYDQQPYRDRIMFLGKTVWSIWNENHLLIVLDK